MRSSVYAYTDTFVTRGCACDVNVWGGVASGRVYAIDCLAFWVEFGWAL